MPGRLDQRRASGPLAAAPPPAASGNPLQRHRREEGRLSLKDESPAARIESAWLAEGAAISSTNLGEVLYIRLRAVGEGSGATDVETMRKHLDVIDPDWSLVAAAAKIKAGGGLSYADAFCIATAARLGAPLWTGDPEIIENAEDRTCEVVDLRPSAAPVISARHKDGESHHGPLARGGSDQVDGGKPW